MNEIVRCWKNLESAIEEEQMFQAYVRVRGEYDAGVRKYLKGDIAKAELERLYIAERNAFQSYSAKTSERPASD